jgi:hypothetical protein
LQDIFDVTVIDKNDFFEANAANLKAAVETGWIDQITPTYNEIVKGNKFNFI